jgi:hypothetical protein
MTANGFKYRDNVPALFAGQNSTAINENAGSIHAGHGHTAGGHVLVAAANGHEAVKALGAHNGFDGVRDDFSGNQRVAHSRCAHGNTIGNSDGVEQD